jgi:hypothetical protein
MAHEKYFREKAGRNRRKTEDSGKNRQSENGEIESENRLYNHVQRETHDLSPAERKMIDIATEKLVTFSQALAYLPRRKNGNGASVETIRLWTVALAARRVVEHRELVQFVAHVIPEAAQMLELFVGVGDFCRFTLAGSMPQSNSDNSSAVTSTLFASSATDGKRNTPCSNRLILA